MKSYQAVLFLVVLTLIMSFSPKKNTASSFPSDLPYFSLRTLEGRLFNRDSIPSNVKTIWVYYSTECEFSKKQAHFFQKEINSIDSKNKFFFVSFEERDSIIKFQNEFQLTQSNVTFLEDYRLTFADKFNLKTYPSILVYDENKKLLQTFEGVTKLKKIVKYL